MANLISLFRTLLCLLVAYLLFTPTTAIYMACFVLTIIVIWMDGLDGYIARKYNESSKTGAVIDIIGDRVVEQVYWVTFLALGWVPVWVVLIVVVRGVTVDGVRSLALEKGLTAFGETSMQQSPVGRFLVASNASRWLYAFFKAVAFASLILAHTNGLNPNFTEFAAQVGYFSVYIALVFCVLRGLPVLIEGKRFFMPKPDTTLSSSN